METGYGALLAEISAAGVEYVVVGGLAVGVNGYVRATKDVDILIPPDPGNARRLRDLLARLGAVRPDGSPIPEGLPDGERFVRARTSLGVLDVLPEGDTPLDFATMRAHAVRATIDGSPVRVVDLQTLVTLKLIAGRPEDRRDLEMLKIAHGELPEPLLDPQALRS
jgi:Nucleotidyltransferase of unknown function (DUF6036)